MQAGTAEPAAPARIRYDACVPSYRMRFMWRRCLTTLHLHHFLCRCTARHRGASTYGAGGGAGATIGAGGGGGGATCAVCVGAQAASKAMKEATNNG